MIQAHQIASDSIRQVVREVLAAPAYRWDRPRSIVDVVGDWLEKVRIMFDSLQQSHPLAYYVVLALLTSLLVAILAHFSYLIWRVIRPRPEASAAAVLKRPSQKGAQWYMDEFRRLMGEGNFAEALANRFRALLLSLDQRQVVRFHPSKTPAEYIAEVRFDEDQRGAFGRLISELYLHLFGGAPCSQMDVLRFDRIAATLEGHAPAQ